MLVYSSLVQSWIFRFEVDLGIEKKDLKEDYLILFINYCFIILVIREYYRKLPMSSIHYCFLIIASYHYFQKDYDLLFIDLEAIHLKYQVNRQYYCHLLYQIMWKVAIYLILVISKMILTQLVLQASYHLELVVTFQHHSHCYLIFSLLL